MVPVAFSAARRDEHMRDQGTSAVTSSSCPAIAPSSSAGTGGTLWPRMPGTSPYMPAVLASTRSICFFALLPDAFHRPALAVEPALQRGEGLDCRFDTAAKLVPGEVVVEGSIFSTALPDNIVEFGRLDDDGEVGADRALVGLQLVDPGRLLAPCVLDAPDDRARECDSIARRLRRPANLMSSRRRPGPMPPPLRAVQCG